jgi:hypothetical protein
VFVVHLKSKRPPHPTRLDRGDWFTGGHGVVKVGFTHNPPDPEYPVRPSPDGPGRGSRLLLLAPRDDVSAPRPGGSATTSGQSDEVDSCIDPAS